MNDFEKLIANAKPHTVFNKDWGQYNSYDFGDTFLPNVKQIRAKGLHIYDGADLFSSTKNISDDILLLTEDLPLTNVIVYTYLLANIEN